jgi:hypothetical protein
MKAKTTSHEWLWWIFEDLGAPEPDSFWLWLMVVIAVGVLGALVYALCRSASINVQPSATVSN